MPRTSPLLPSSDTHHHQYSKSEKTKKPFPPSSSPSHSSRLPLPILVFSIFCLLVGISGTIFSLLSLSRHQSPPVFRCGRIQDSFRGHYLSTADTQRSSKLNGLDRPKFLGFVGILTGFDSADRRLALRSSWFPSDPEGLLRLEQATGLAFRFVIGRSKDAKKMANLTQEVNEYKDFMRIDFEEDHAKSPSKTLAFFKAAFQLFDADYYVKAGDDIYLRPDRLATLLAKE